MHMDVVGTQKVCFILHLFTLTLLNLTLASLTTGNVTLDLHSSNIMMF